MTPTLLDEAIAALRCASDALHHHIEQDILFADRQALARVAKANVDSVLAKRREAAKAEIPAISQFARDVITERERQKSVEGWTPERDDAHEAGALANAAACYAAGEYSDIWPWDESWWKPTNPRRNLEKAAALIIAEGERIDRAAAKGAIRALPLHPTKDVSK